MVANFLKLIRPGWNRYTIIGAVLFFGGWLLVPFLIGVPIMMIGWPIMIFGFFGSFFRLIPGHDGISARLKKELKPHRDFFKALWQEFKE